MIELLDAAERLKLADVFENEFDGSLVPNAEQAHIAAVVEGGEVKAFIVSEVLIRVGMIWVKPEMRNTAKSASWLKKLVRYVTRSIPHGSSAIVIDSDGENKTLLKRLGLRDVEGQVYRMDFD